MGIEELFFVGIVSSYGPGGNTVVVRRPDKDDRTTAELFIVSQGSHETKDYWMPAIEDQVLCLLLPNTSGKGPGTGYVLGTIYSSVDLPPAGATPSARVLNHPGDMILNIGGTFTLNAGTLDIQGAGDVKAGGVSLTQHVHGGILPGPSDTATPH
jgi:phage baseplate assembly protein gpV